jgi:hypothetical protein
MAAMAGRLVTFKALAALEVILGMAEVVHPVPAKRVLAVAAALVVTAVPGQMEAAAVLACLVKEQTALPGVLEMAAVVLADKTVPGATAVDLAGAELDRMPMAVVAAHCAMPTTYP